MRRRLWVPLAPLTLYAGWWIWAQRFDQGIASLSNLTDVPAFVAESAVATLSALTGFAGSSVAGRAGAVAEVAEVVFVLAAAGTLLYLALRLRERPVGPWLLPYLLILLAFWVALGFSQGPGREPATPRYLFFGSIMVLLVVAARTRGVRPTRTAVACPYCVFPRYRSSSTSPIWSAPPTAFDAAATNVQAQLGVLELAGEAANPGFVPRGAAPEGRDVAIDAARYLALVEATGSLGFSSAELSAEQPSIRAGADLGLARAEGLLAVPVQPASPDSGELRAPDVGDRRPGPFRIA